MVDCLSYVCSGNTMSKPEGTCCSGLKIVLKSKCLCEAFKNSSQFGVSLNVTKALALPSACKIFAPSISNCGDFRVLKSWNCEYRVLRRFSRIQS